MAISDRQFAAEIIDTGGSVAKFDDMGCLIQYVRERKLKEKVAACFVMDYKNRKWLPARQAHYVKSAEIHSPMASGLAAFGDRSKAEETAGRFRGRILLYDDLWRE
jgi:copper chaperone NosL